jgi:hypothetical protein
MYECEKSPLTHELSYIGILKFSHISFFHVYVICKKWFKKIFKFFSFFVTPTIYEPMCEIYGKRMVWHISYT